MKRELSSKPAGHSAVGQEMAEFAIALTLLLMVVFGVLDLGQAFHAAITIANAAREGARAGVRYDWSKPDGYAAVESAALLEAQDAGLDPARMQVFSNCGACASGASLVVTVTYDCDLIIGLFLADFTLQRTATMMIP